MSVNKLTVFGGGGFIGSSVISASGEYGYDAERGDWSNIDPSKELGHVVYCLGVGDCKRPGEVLNSHLGVLHELVSKGKFSRLIYVSSTRVYMGGEGSQENGDVVIESGDNRKLFNLVKLAAEAYLEASGIDYRIVRPSNVFGLALDSPLFLPSIVRDAVNKGEVHMHVAPSYAKDYVYIGDVANLILKVAQSSEQKNYNIASGENVSAQQLADILTKETGCSVVWHENNCSDVFPITDISLIEQEFRYVPKRVTALLSQMVADFKSELLT